MSSSTKRRVKTSCVHYRWDGDYSLNLCMRAGEHAITDFNCKDCQDFITHNRGLKKCPFCGGNAYLDKTYELKDEWEVFCQKCYVSMKKRGIKKAVDSWNSRKPL